MTAAAVRHVAAPLLVACCAIAPATAAIALPEPLAVEIPVAGQSTINAADPPMSTLLESATSPLGPVTHDRVGYEFPLGPTLVTWSDGTDTAAAHVYVYPFGQSPVGSTDYERATSGNGGTNVVRDLTGRIHVAWLDSGRGDDRVLYRSGVQDPDSGAITWDTGPVRLSEDVNDTYNSMVAVAVSADFVHFAWYGGGNRTYYRRLRLSDHGFEPIRNTTATGSLSNNGPDIAVRGNDEIHVVTPANSGGGGQHAVSLDGGLSWSTGNIPRPAVGITMKAAAVAVDRHGNAHVVFPWLVRDISASRYWELRYVRRTPAGTWEDAQFVLAQFPEWGDPRADADPTNDGWDVLSDWLEITVDGNDDLHVAWHGTVHTHAFGQDEAFYIRRPSTGPGTWSSTWDPYVTLWPFVDGLSFAPSVVADAESDLALPIVFHDVNGAEDYDSNFKQMRGGAWDGQPALPLTTMAADGYGLSTWFPCVAPGFFVHRTGRVWIDVVATDWPAESSSDMLIVHQRREVTALLSIDPILTVGPTRLDWTPRNDASGYDVVRGDLHALRAAGGDFSVATVVCVADDHPEVFFDHAEQPGPGQAFWLLARGVGAGVGFTYDTRSPRQVAGRDAGIAAAAGSCP